MRTDRAIGRAALAVGLAACMTGAPPPASAGATTGSQGYTSFGEHLFVVPAGVTSVHAVLLGGSGGLGYNNGIGTLLAPGGAGGVATATLAVSPGEALFVEVASNGGNATGAGPGGGGSGGGAPGGLENGGGGGGASDVRACSTNPVNPANPVGCALAPSLGSRLAVAGGGGGGGGTGSAESTVGGGGGGPAGSGGGDGGCDAGCDPVGGGGGPGGQAAGGAAGLNSGDTAAAKGGAGGGGSGGNEQPVQSALFGGGGGGGGGLFGGGGGGGGFCHTGSTSLCSGGGGGGGGSSGVPAGATGVSGFASSVAATGTPASATIFWTLPAPTVTTGAPSGVSPTGATLNGTINANGSQVTDCHFEIVPAPPAGGQVPCLQQVGGGSTPVAVSAAVSALTRGGSYSYRLVAANTEGTSNGDAVAFVAGSSVAGASGPHLTRLRQSAARWRPGSALARITRRAKPPVGTTFSFGLDEPATVRLAFKQNAPGRKVGGRCVPQTKRNKRKRRCTRTVIVGTLSLRAHAGTDKVRFQGRLSRRRTLKLGRYTVVATATDASGATSAPNSLRFTMVKG